MKSVSVQNVSKKFLVPQSRPRNLADGLRSLIGRHHKEEFWALRDISFDVDEGEAFGIIGHNGAGKSTMLKLLTRIMEPTYGSIRTRGRVSALIEIGAGFHPEMSGRENIYLNGSILGMTRREIERKFDDIVAFAELERFIDMPVKRYSSGMYARLGFAVIAHLEPEILLVDEVLSVGDAAFQAKCQTHMGKLLTSGATVVFVSHNLPAVARICARCMVLCQGRSVYEGTPAEAIRYYRKLQQASVSAAPAEPGEQGANACAVRINSVRLLDRSGNDVEELAAGDQLTILVTGFAPECVSGLNMGVEIARSDGIKCVDINSGMDGFVPDVKAGEFTCELTIPRLDLTDGAYWISVGLMDASEKTHYQTLHNCASVYVREDRGYRGVARLEHIWNLSQAEGRDRFSGDPEPDRASPFVEADSGLRPE
ncbi:MAG: ABC transporter ATP-binding protein [Armatimonadota bacterium]